MKKFEFATRTCKKLLCKLQFNFEGKSPNILTDPVGSMVVLPHVKLSCRKQIRYDTGIPGSHSILSSQSRMLLASNCQPSKVLITQLAASSIR